MATFGEYWSIPGLSAASTLASSQYYVVQLCSTAGQVKLATSGTSVVIGIVQNDPGAGEAADVAFLGIAKAACEASTTIGAYLKASSTGRVKITTTDTDIVIGRALEAYSTAGGIIRVALGGAFCGDYAA